MEMQIATALLRIGALATLLCSAWGCTPQPTKPLARKNGLEVPSQVPLAQDTTSIQSPMASEISTTSVPSGTDEPQRHPQSPAETSPVIDSEPATVQSKEPPETWTSKRLVVLAPGGAVVIDFAVNLGGKSIQEATQSSVDGLVHELWPDNPLPIAWSKLLENSVIASGWLGNLVPMPNQVDQILNLYDVNRDGMASKDEIVAFLTRGAARGELLRITQVEPTDDSMVNKSPWGPGDLNEDRVLDDGELSRLEESLLRFDFNGDQSVSQEELQTSTNLSAVAAEMNSNRSMIDQDFLIAWNDSNAAQLAPKIIGHYAFTEQISRDEWHAWADDRWRLLDTDGDLQLSGQELRRLGEIPAVERYEIRFPNCLVVQESKALRVTRIDGRNPHDPSRWVSHDAHAGQLLLNNCWLRIEAVDTFSAKARQAFEQQIRSSIDNAQLRLAITRTLELQSSALEKLDSDGDKKISDRELQTAWKWFTCIRQLLPAARWQSSASPWFQLADSDGNRRLTLADIHQFRKVAVAWDRNRNLSIEPNELPLTMLLNFSRDGRGTNFQALALGRSPEVETKVEYPDWFTATDMNDDGFLSKSEFLGYPKDFEVLDTDQDGLISNAEAHIPRRLN